MKADHEVDASARRGRRLGRVLWIIGWCLLLAVSACAAYAIMVVGGR